MFGFVLFNAFIYPGIIARYDHDIKQTRAMLLMFPEESITSTPYIRQLMKRVRCMRTRICCLVSLTDACPVPHLARWSRNSSEHNTRPREGTPVVTLVGPCSRISPLLQSSSHAVACFAPLYQREDGRDAPHHS